LKLNCREPLSTFAFKFNLRRYNLYPENNGFSSTHLGKKRKLLKTGLLAAAKAAAAAGGAGGDNQMLASASSSNAFEPSFLELTAMPQSRVATLPPFSYSFE
jgi:hypothetical protein